MTVCLLDANVLIALVDLDHEFNDAASRWFTAHHASGWATCPLTENAVLRIIGHRRYLGVPGGPATVTPLLRQLISKPGHVFWPDDISLLDPRQVALDRLGSHASVTDTYLLALAVAHGGRLATFDRRLVVDAVPGGADALHLIAA